MKKLICLCVVLLSVALFSCSNDDTPKMEKVISFETALQAGQSEFIADGTPNAQGFQKTTFSDPEGLATFTHEYADWGSGYSFAAFTYMNKTDSEAAINPTPICGTGKLGKVYMAVYDTGGEWGNPAIMTINNPDYTIKGAWITNSTVTYYDMVNGGVSATAFTAGSWYKVTAYGLDDSGNTVAQTEIYLANYTSDSDKPVDNWIWFDLTPLAGATKIQFLPSSSDTGAYGMNTSAYFCLDGITLIEK